jgi:membrane associated rhomboid family serine protease
MMNEDLKTKERKKLERKIFFHSLVFPSLFLVVIWLVKLYEVTTGVSLAEYGNYPLHIKGLRGILFSPLIHSSFKHLIDNSIPLLFLGVALFYFYRGLAYRIFLYSYFFSGIILWIIGRHSYHIGASGVIYALAFFLFFSGVFRKYFRLMALSLIIVFLYGSMVWGLFPLKVTMSWEGHLAGAITGVALAVIYRKQGPQRPKYSWEIEEEEEEEEENIQNGHINTTNTGEFNINLN